MTAAQSFIYLSQMYRGSIFIAMWYKGSTRSDGLQSSCEIRHCRGQLLAHQHRQGSLPQIARTMIKLAKTGVRSWGIGDQ